MVWGFPGGSDGKESACNAGDLGLSLDWEDPLKKGMATYSSILVWRNPWTEEPGRLQSMGSQRVGHDWGTNPLTFTLQQSDRAKVTHKLLSAVTAPTVNLTWSCSQGFFLYYFCLPAPCSSLVIFSGELQRMLVGTSALTHLVAFIFSHHTVQITGKPGKVFLFLKDLNCENLLLHAAYSGYQGKWLFQG